MVLGSLVGAMTVASALLLVLEPRPSLRPVGDMSLSSVESARVVRPTDLIGVASGVVPAGWDAIVVHQTGHLAGDGDTAALFRGDRSTVPGGYHFVVGNGHGSADGELAVTADWVAQRVFTPSPSPLRPGQDRAIRVLIVGDNRRRAPTELQVRRLTWLVQQLQFRHGIGADRVVLRDGSGRGAIIGDLFPEAWFRQQLLTSRSY